MTRLVEKRRAKGLVPLSFFKIHPSLFLPRFPMDRHGLRPRDEKRGESAWPKVNLFPEQIPQDFFGQSFVYLSMAGNGLGQTLIRVMINIVLGSVPEQLATTFLELLDESDSLHATSS